MSKKQKCHHGRGACCDNCHVEGCTKQKIFTPKKSPLAGLADQAKRDPLSLLAPELRRAVELEKTDPEEAKRIRDAFWEKAHKEIEEARKDEEDKKNRTGKYDPINIALGKCKVCQGDIVERLKWHYHGEIRYGGPSNASRVRDCLFCKGCGIVYAFVPKD